jgi:hypothetical protein
VCASSTSAYAASATSLYESYCDSIYGTATFSEAFVEEASAAAMSSELDFSLPLVNWRKIGLRDRQEKGEARS